MEASLRKRFTVPFCACGVGLGDGEVELPPHPTEKSKKAAERRPSVIRDKEDFIGVLLRRGRASENFEI